MAGLVRRVQEVAAEAQAQQCIGFYINPEIVHYNPAYFELAAKLSWRPEAVSLSRFVADYAQRRYGKAARPQMERCLRTLVASVYSTASREGEPHYQHRLRQVGANPGAYRFVGPLRQALDLALAAAEGQGDNPLLANDLVDLFRQYGAELSNFHLQELQQAFLRGDRPRFESEAEAVTRLLEAIEMVVSVRPDYRLSRLSEKACRLRHDPQAGRYLRDTYCTFAGNPWLLDYSSKDLFELIHAYYRPRVEAFIEALRLALRAPAEVSSPNLLHNPGFEEGEGDAPAGWRTDFVHNGGRAGRVSEGGVEGAHAGLLECPRPGSYANLWQDVACAPGQAYRLSARVRVEGGCTASLHVDFLKPDLPWPQSVFAQQAVAAAQQDDPGWQNLAGWFLPPEGTAFLRIYCRQNYCEEKGPQRAFFDAVTLQQAPAAQAPVVNVTALEARYARIESDWLNNPLPSLPPFAGNAAEAVRTAMQMIEISRRWPF